MAGDNGLVVLTASKEFQRETIGNVSENLTEYINRSVVLTGATIASPITMFVLGMLGNILALIILHRTRVESQRLMFHGLVGGLVWNDLTGILVLTPITVSSYIIKEMPGEEHLCKFFGFAMVCFGLSTPMIVSAMALERFLFVKYTFFYTKHCSPSGARLLILTIWAFVLIFGLLPLFGFGDYVLQYPWTWCFLQFHSSNSVEIGYAYLYALFNILLIVVMAVCNLVVVWTLVRARNYRRRNSSISMSSTYIRDIDETVKAKRKKRQKDVELQMIVVVCAITIIFSVCWLPLMAHILVTLNSGDGGDQYLGLVAIRLASLNQVLNPWLYVILRKSLIARLKKFFCKTKKSKDLKPGYLKSTKRHKYIHVRNQFFHSNHLVDGELSDSLRNLSQKAIPAAMSLPDVMIINTGKRDASIPTVENTKALSFGGRVSYSLDLDELPIAQCACGQYKLSKSSKSKFSIHNIFIQNSKSTKTRKEDTEYKNKCSINCDCRHSNVCQCYEKNTNKNSFINDVNKLNSKNTSNVTKSNQENPSSVVVSKCSDKSCKTVTSNKSDIKDCLRNSSGSSKSRTISCSHGNCKYRQSLSSNKSSSSMKASETRGYRWILRTDSSKSGKFMDSFNIDTNDELGDDDPFLNDNECDNTTDDGMFSNSKTDSLPVNDTSVTAISKDSESLSDQLCQSCSKCSHLNNERTFNTKCVCDVTNQLHHMPDNRRVKTPVIKTMSCIDPRVKGVSKDENQSSGIFSAESPCSNKRDIGQCPAATPSNDLKERIRRVKSGPSTTN